MLQKLGVNFTKEEQDLIDSLDTPEKIQAYIDTQITYDPHCEDRSVKEVVVDKKAECYNGALFALTCLLNQGMEASVIELLAKEDEEHILCVYKVGDSWGSIAQSKYLGLKGRAPIYQDIRDLAVSYKEFYFGFDGRYSLVSYTNPLDLFRYDLAWLTDKATVVQMAKDIREAKHFDLVSPNSAVYYVPAQRYWSEVLVIPEGTVIPQYYLSKKPTR
jgi:hypothetical protein